MQRGHRIFAATCYRLSRVGEPTVLGPLRAELVADHIAQKARSTGINPSQPRMRCPANVAASRSSKPTSQPISVCKRKCGTPPAQCVPPVCPSDRVTIVMSSAALSSPAGRTSTATYGATGVDQKQGVGIGGTLLRSGQVIDAEGVAAGMAAGGAKLDAARQPVSCYYPTMRGRTTGLGGEAR